MSERRNDPQHFPALNGAGHRRRKAGNVPTASRFQLNPYEVLALEIIGVLDQLLADEQPRRSQPEAEQ